MKFFIETYGCQMNVADSELVTSILLSAGMIMVNNIDEADVILFNTCSVRKHAEDRVLGRISNEKKRKLTNSAIKIVVLGCMAQRIGEKLVGDDIGIDIAVGVDQYARLPEMLFGSNTANCLLELNGEEVYSHLQPTHKSDTNGFVTIMRGCNNFCTYCIVPYVRGRERSRSFEAIYNDVQQAGENGLKDITLLGQNVNSYKDSHCTFPELLKRLNDIDSIYRLRFITSHPKDLSDKLIEVMAESDKVCEHIHLPMQSGDDNILHKMNRKYSISYYIHIIDKLRNAIPNIAITTDIIAGFPSETESEFLNTVTAIKEIGFDHAFCFKYSPRLGTQATEIKDTLTEDIRLSRLQQLIDIQREITLRKFQAQIGNNVEIYIESLSKKSSSQISGTTRDFKIAVLDGLKSQIGTLTKARVIQATAGTLICEPC